MITLRTNASPVYLVLFISATYVLNRPCVYCSLLLAILVLSLFDFHTDNWFEPRYRRPESLDSFFTNPSSAHNQTSSGSLGLDDASALNASMIIPDVVKDTFTMASAVVNSSVAAAINSAISVAPKLPVPDVELSASGVGEWVRGIFRREWRINCLDLVLRL